MSTASHGGHGPVGQSPEDFARSQAAGHEMSDARTGPLVVSTIGLFILIIAAFAAMGLMLALSAGGVNDFSNTISDDPVSQQQLPPAPRLEQNPAANGEQMINEANAQISSYGWVNKGAGTAHIPIERAMELLLERGAGPLE